MNKYFFENLEKRVNYLLISISILLLASMDMSSKNHVHLKSTDSDDSWCFELYEAKTILNSNSKAAKGSLEDCIIQAYFFQNYEEFWYEPPGNFWFLNVPKDEFIYLKDQLTFSLKSKFYYQISNVNYCLIRSIIITKDGYETPINFGLIYSNGRWKASGPAKIDPRFQNRFIAWFDHEYQYEVLVNRNSKDPILNTLINSCTNKENGQLKLHSLGAEVKQGGDAYKKYYAVPNKPGHDRNWWKKYVP